jgi:hypothetical protein
MGKRIYFYITAIIIIAITGLNTTPAFAASEVDSKLSETKEAVQKLLQVKDDTTISEEDRARLELQLKKSIISGIIDISSAQLKEAREQLRKLSFPASEDWNDIKDAAFASLDAYEKFYREAKTELQTSGMTLEKTTILARKLEEKKTGEIDAFVREISNIGAVFGISDVLKLGDERLKKVGDDVEKVYAQKLVQKTELRNSLQKASQALAAGRQTNNRTKEIILHLYEPGEAASSSKSFHAALENDVRAYLRGKTGTSTATATSSALKEVSKMQKEEYLQELIRKSAEQVRDAYDIFLQMSVSVKGYIKE